MQDNTRLALIANRKILEMNPPLDAEHFDKDRVNAWQRGQELALATQGKADENMLRKQTIDCLAPEIKKINEIARAQRDAAEKIIDAALG